MSIQKPFSLIVIPDDEPIMIFRARDKHAAHTIRDYLGRCRDEKHASVVYERIKDFEQFAKDHPDRMKEPDTELKSNPKLR